MATSETASAIKPDVAVQLAEMYARIGQARASSEARFNRFAAETQVDGEMGKPADSLRATLARIKDTVQHRNEPDAPAYAGGTKAKETTLV